MAGLLDFLSLKDMFDGGGAGKAGSTFEGGPLSELLNGLGVRPMGFRERMAQQGRMPQPTGPAPRPAAPPPTPAAPPPNPYAPGAVTQSTLPPLPPPGQMSNDELVRLILQALQAGPSATGYGRR